MKFIAFDLETTGTVPGVDTIIEIGAVQFVNNHPTAISPFPGASTGAGGEIRDEGATGRGAKPKAGLTGFTVSNLMLPDAPQPWENDRDVIANASTTDTVYGKPDRIASPLQIMLDGPLGGAAFNNEFGRPNLAGYFREFEQTVAGQRWGYHKPIMIAGGLGTIDAGLTHKIRFPAGTLLVQLGGPGMRIGMGGSAASSSTTASGARWTPTKKKSSSTTCMPAAKRPGRSGRTSSRRLPRPRSAAFARRPAHAKLVMPCTLSASTVSSASSVSALTPTTSKSVAAARCCG